MIRAPPVCALTAQIASICISNVELQQFFAPESRPNSFVTPNFTVETFIEHDGVPESKTTRLSGFGRTTIFSKRSSVPNPT